MKKIIVAVVLSLFLFGCFETTSFNIKISNTSRDGAIQMTKSLFSSMEKLKEDFVVLELTATDITNFKNGTINSNNEMLTWLEDGICTSGTNYSCEGTLSVKNTRLSIFYGDMKDLSNDGERAINFYDEGELKKSFTISSLRTELSNSKLSMTFEYYFKKSIVDNINLNYIELGNLTYFKASGQKRVEIDDLQTFYNPEINANEKEYATLKNLMESNSSFILLVTSLKEVGQTFCIFSGDIDGEYVCEEEQSASEAYASNICNQPVDFTNYCNKYKTFLTNVANKHGFKFYHININSKDEENAVSKYIALIGSPTINIVINGVHQDAIYGPVSQEYIENRLLTWGVVDSSLDFSVSCGYEHIGTCQGENKELNLMSEDGTMSLLLSYSTDKNARYFVSNTKQSSISSSTYLSYYQQASSENGFKATFVEDEENSIFEREVSIKFNEEGTYYIYLYSEDSLGNKGFSEYQLNILIGPINE